MSMNCYFWVDETVSEEDRLVNAMCEECHDKTPKTPSWFWEGSVKGYGPYDYVCECGRVIHEAIK